MATANFQVQPEDGWVTVASNVDFIRIRQYPKTQPFYVTTGSSAPSLSGTYATGTLTFTGEPNDGGTVTVGDITYTFVDAFDDPGPYDVQLGANQTEAEANLTDAINGRAVIPAVAATGTITISGGVPTAADTVDIGDETYTFVASATDPFEVEIGGTASETGDNLEAAIMADSALVSASNSGGVVTITALEPGFAGNSIALAESADNVAVSGPELTDGEDEGPAIAANPLATATDGAGTVTITATPPNFAGNDVALSENATNVAASGATLSGGTTLAGYRVDCEEFVCDVSISDTVYVRTVNPQADHGLQIDVFFIAGS